MFVAPQSQVALAALSPVESVENLVLGLAIVLDFLTQQFACVECDGYAPSRTVGKRAHVPQANECIPPGVGAFITGGASATPRLLWAHDRRDKPERGKRGTLDKDDQQLAMAWCGCPLPVAEDQCV